MKRILHIIQNSHTDLGYTHRQEYVYRAHARYIDYAIKCSKEDSKFKWTLENYWMVENYKKWSSEEKFEELKKYIKKGNIEVTANFLNVLNIFDNDAYEKKIRAVKKKFPETKVAIQQDVNSISMDQAMILSNNNIKYFYGSIHTHHGMFIGKGKQRGFIWELNNGKKITVWGGEHYMLGNELGLHLQTPNKYTFKDDIELIESDDFKQGFIRLNGYLDLLDEEKVEEENIPIVLSGTVIDNSPPNPVIVKAVENMNKMIGDKAEIKISTMHEFFESINESKLPIYKGEWPSWWVDGVISTPESVRQYREAQTIYKNLNSYIKNGGKLDDELLEKLEYQLLIFSEHTWGSWSSQGNPFSNGNNLLLDRKKQMATEASRLSWMLWDQMKENEGYNIVKVDETNKIKIINIHDEKIEKIVALELPRTLRGIAEKDRYVNFEDVIEVIDSEGKVYESAISRNMGLNENLNVSIETDQILMVKVTLNGNSSKILEIRNKNIGYKPRTSSIRPIGVDNQNDINYNEKVNCKYLRDGIENQFYEIRWNKEGIYRIFDKKLKKNLLESGKFIRPIRTISPNDSRTVFGRNRQGPSMKKSLGKLISHKRVTDKENVQLVTLIFEMDGSKRTELNLRVSSLTNEINFQLVLHKKGYRSAENVYISLPFEHEKIKVHSGGDFFIVGKDQLPNTNLDYYRVQNGMIFDNVANSVGVKLQDTPLIQVGSILYEQRRIMDTSPHHEEMNPAIWIMSNYWETNYKGTLEGCYSFSFAITSGNKQEKIIREAHKQLIAFNIWE